MTDTDRNHLRQLLDGVHRLLGDARRLADDDTPAAAMIHDARCAVEYAMSALDD